MTKQQQTREQWLNKVAGELRQYIFDTTGETVPSVSLSFGFPGGRGNKTGVIGQCWNKRVVADGKAAIFVNPVLSDPIRIADVVAHELVHALHPDAGHTGDFRKTAVAIGLEGKMTATVAGEQLKSVLAETVKRAGTFQHGAVNPSGTLTKSVPDPKNPGSPKLVPLTPWGTPKQKSYLLKVVCPDDGYTVRVTQKHLSIGYPSCPCGAEMVNG